MFFLLQKLWYHTNFFKKKIYDTLPAHIFSNPRHTTHVFFFKKMYPNHVFPFFPYPHPPHHTYTPPNTHTHSTTYTLHHKHPNLWYTSLLKKKTCDTIYIFLHDTIHTHTHYFKKSRHTSDVFKRMSKFWMCVCTSPEPQFFSTFCSVAIENEAKKRCEWGWECVWWWGGSWCGEWFVSKVIKNLSFWKEKCVGRRCGCSWNVNCYVLSCTVCERAYFTLLRFCIAAFLSRISRAASRFFTTGGFPLGSTADFLFLPRFREGVPSLTALVFIGPSGVLVAVLRRLDLRWGVGAGFFGAFGTFGLFGTGGALEGLVFSEFDWTDDLVDALDVGEVDVDEVDVDEVDVDEVDVDFLSCCGVGVRPTEKSSGSSWFFARSSSALKCFPYDFSMWRSDMCLGGPCRGSTKPASTTLNTFDWSNLVK